MLPGWHLVLLLPGTFLSTHPFQPKPTQLTHNRHASTLTTTRSQQHTTLSPPPTRRTFTTTPHLLKKGGKAARDESKSQQQASSSKGAAAPADDPNDFSTLEADIATAVERLKDDLSKLRAGGRFNPELLENLRVQPDKNNAERVKLSDVAQVVPKGRTVQVLVGERDVCLKPFPFFSFAGLRLSDPNESPN
jgi:hypothetical protein